MPRKSKTIIEATKEVLAPNTSTTNFQVIDPTASDDSNSNPDQIVTSTATSGKITDDSEIQEKKNKVLEQKETKPVVFCPEDGIEEQTPSSKS